MTTIDQLLVQIDATTEGLRRELARADRAVQAAGGRIDRSLAQVDKRFASVESIARGAGRALATFGVGFSVAAVVGGLKQVVDIAQQSEQARLKIEALIRTTGSAAGRTAEQIDTLAVGLARSTLASTDGVREAAAALLTFKSVAGDAFDRTLVLAQDLAAIGMGSLESATKQLGKALEDPIRGLSSLREVGVSFTAQQEEMIKALDKAGERAQAQAEILKVLEAQVGGAGAAQGSGLAGAFDTLGVNMALYIERSSEATGLTDLLKWAILGLGEAVGVLADDLTPANRLAEIQKQIAELEAAAERGPRARQAAEEQLAPLYAERAKITERIAKAEQDAADAAVKSAEAQKAAAAATAKSNAATAAEKAAEKAQKAAKEWSDLVYKIESDAAKAAAARRQALTTTLEGLDRETELLRLKLSGQESLIPILEAEWQWRAQIAGLQPEELEALREKLKLNEKLKDQIEQQEEAEKKRAKAAEDAAREVERMVDSVTQYIADNLADTAFSETERNWRETWDSMERWALRALARIAAEAIIRPQIQAVFGATGAGGAGGVGGFGGSAAALGFGGSFGSLGGLSGGLSAGMALGNVLFNGASWMTGSDAVVSAFGQVGGYLGGTSGASSFAKAGDAFSSPIGSIGSFAANMALNAILGDRGMGSSIGSTIGAIGGSFLGPWGTVAGSAIGNIIGGLFGGAKPTVGPNAYAQTNLSGGSFIPWESAADNGGDAASLVTLSAQITGAYQDILAGLGAQVAADAEASFHLGNFPSQGGIWTMLNGGGRQTFGEDSEAAIADIILDLFRSVDLTGISDDMADAIKRAADSADGLEQFATDLETIQLLLSGDPLETETLSAIAVAFEAIDDKVAELTPSLERLGLPLDMLVDKANEAKAAITEGFNDAITQAILSIEDPLAAALAAFEDAAEAQLQEAEDAGANIVEVERLHALQRQQIIEQFASGATRALDGLSDWLLGLNTGDLSALAPGSQVDLARAEFEETAAAALSGSADAIARFTAVADTFLGESRAYNASSEAYAMDFERVRAIAAALMGGGAAGDNVDLSLLGSGAGANVPSAYVNLDQLAPLMAENNRLVGEVVNLLAPMRDDIESLRSDIASLVTKATERNRILEDIERAA